MFDKPTDKKKDKIISQAIEDSKKRPFKSMSKTMIGIFEELVKINNNRKQ